MVTTSDASSLSLEDVHRLLKLQRQVSRSIASVLVLEPLSQLEQNELEKICSNFEAYYNAGKISEGQVQFLFLSPLM